MVAGRSTTAEQESTAIAIINQRPGIDQDRLAVAMGSSPLRKTGSGRNHTISELILRLAREGKIQAVRSEFARRNEPYKLYPANHRFQQRQLFQPVTQFPCTVIRAGQPAQSVSEPKPSREYRPVFENLADRECNKPVKPAPIKPEKQPAQRTRAAQTKLSQRNEPNHDSYLPYISILRPTSLAEFMCRSHLSYQGAKTVLGHLIEQGKVRAFSQGWIRVIERREA